ncbi:MAG: acyl transferase, partial [Saprospiraceae bacterium]
MSSAEYERHSLLNRIYDINEKTFGTVATDVWRYQYYRNGLYRSYCHLIGKTIESVTSIEEIPFLPIAMFREHDIQSGDWVPEKIFRSSGTTGAVQSKHLVRHLTHYHQNAWTCFSSLFGDPGEFVWLGLLPS